MTTAISMTKTAISADRLREILCYCPDTGVFIWRIRISQRTRAGDIAGSPDRYGYRIIKIDGRSYKAHRLAWLYVNGEWPSVLVDHKNLDKSDNCWKNLRQATYSQNQQNRCIQANNTSRYVGVHWHKQACKWHARIGVDGDRKTLGLFSTPEDAYAAYMLAKRRLHEFGTL